MAKATTKKAPAAKEEAKPEEKPAHCTLRFVSGAVDVTPGASREPLRDDEWCRMVIQGTLTKHQRQRLADWCRDVLMKL